VLRFCRASWNSLSSRIRCCDLVPLQARVKEKEKKQIEFDPSLKRNKIATTDTMRRKSASDACADRGPDIEAPRNATTDTAGDLQRSVARSPSEKPPGPRRVGSEPVPACVAEHNQSSGQPELSVSSNSSSPLSLKTRAIFSQARKVSQVVPVVAGQSIPGSRESYSDSQESVGAPKQGILPGVSFITERNTSGKSKGERPNEEPGPVPRASLLSRVAAATLRTLWCGRGHETTSLEGAGAFTPEACGGAELQQIRLRFLSALCLAGAFAAASAASLAVNAARDGFTAASMVDVATVATCSLQVLVVVRPSPMVPKLAVLRERGAKRGCCSAPVLNPV